MNRMRLYGLTVMVLLAGLRVDASPQIPEEINYGGRMFKMNSKPLEMFFSKDNPAPLWGQKSSACSRGYVGSWKVEESSLWLASLATATGEPVSPSAVNKAWTFPIKATWYTGNLLVNNKIIQVKEGRIVGEHEADVEHPLAVRIEAESLTATNIVSATIRRTTEIKPGEYKITPREEKIIPREELDGLLKVMAMGKKAGPRKYKTDAEYRDDRRDGYYVMLKGGMDGNTGGIFFEIYDDGSGMYMVDFIGNNFESKELAALAKRIYESTKTVPANMRKDGSSVAAPEEKQP